LIVSFRNFFTTPTGWTAALLITLGFLGLAFWHAHQGTAGIMAAARYSAAIALFGIARLTAACPVCTRQASGLTAPV
jgi:hypothetical protein